MTSWSILAWSALLLGPGTPDTARATGPTDPLGPIVTIESRGAPTVFLRHQAAPDLVAIRLSVPITGPAGTGLAPRVHAELTRRRLAAGAEPFGAWAEAVATPTHLVHTLTGPASTFNDLVDLLRESLAGGAPAPRELRAAQLAAMQRSASELETPVWRVRRELRRVLFPTTVEPEGIGSADAVSARDLVAFWRRNLRPERMTAVVVGPVDRKAVEGAFRDWPRLTQASGSSDQQERALELPDPEVNLPWAGIGYMASGTDLASLAVAARLIDQRLAASGLRVAEAELWWADGRHALVVIGSAPLGRSASTLTQRLREAVAEAAESVDAVAISAPRRELRNGLLYQARTPAGLAGVIGDFHDRTGRPDGAIRFLEALDRVSSGSVRRDLQSLLGGAPVTVEITP